MARKRYTSQSPENTASSSLGDREVVLPAASRSALSLQAKPSRKNAGALEGFVVYERRLEVLRAALVDGEIDIVAASVDEPVLRNTGAEIGRWQAPRVLADGRVADDFDDEV